LTIQKRDWLEKKQAIQTEVDSDIPSRNRVEEVTHSKNFGKLEFQIAYLEFSEK
jgi:hypothetical protein